ncbi:MAG: SsrA-binding protein SmpB [Flavobacteriales bacterium]|nr:SsrA-binding protein [Flavobacteriales bacterium]HRE76012.1 SsrA-binding protein SmpB [Flavobacteriales bacterium]HRE97280.1 SsrA-binding protein SmpB [Flavobacteriales bacterium]HRJ35589.1 SsrA-binding protein SmpB [Flavobacteriales bacterium]HRJ39292.1 SsrA-binding protein SmpB [Flavobacteriales bacterium]
MSKVSIRNKKASFEYHLNDVYVAGIMLTGTEIKSIRASKASINEAYCFLHNGELWVKGMHIAEYEPGSYNNHAPLRERKLLLNAREIEKIEKELKVKGTTLIPLEIFLNEKGIAKLKIALATGKKLFDKRDDLKLKDAKREMDRVKKARL